MTGNLAIEGGEESKRSGLTRAFICARMPDEAVKEIARLQEILGGRKFTGKMTELENLHVTLKFLGEIEDVKLEEVRRRLRAVSFEKFEARLSGIGTFSSQGRPHIVWVKIGGKGIFELQEKIDAALAGLYEKEQRFMSQLTVARVKYVADGRGFSEHVRKIAVRDVRFSIGEFFLMKSELQAMRPRYEEIERYIAEN